MTPNSSSATYLTSEDFLLRRDVRSVMGYCTDNGNDPLMNAPLALQEMSLNDPGTKPGLILLRKLMSASGKLESAVLRSKIYTVGGIQAMLSTENNSAEYCKELLASIAMYELIYRRPGPDPPATAVNSYTEAMSALNDLSIGVRIFAFAETAEAGLPETREFNEGDYISNNFFTARSRPMFGDRGMAKRNLVNGGGCGGDWR